MIKSLIPKVWLYYSLWLMHCCMDHHGYFHNYYQTNWYFSNSILMRSSWSWKMMVWFLLTRCSKTHLPWKNHRQYDTDLLLIHPGKHFLHRNIDWIVSNVLKVTWCATLIMSLEWSTKMDTPCYFSWVWVRPLELYNPQGSLHTYWWTDTYFTGLRCSLFRLPWLSTFLLVVVVASMGLLVILTNKHAAHFGISKLYTWVLLWQLILPCRTNHWIWFIDKCPSLEWSCSKVFWCTVRFLLKSWVTFTEPRRAFCKEVSSVCMKAVYVGKLVLELYCT